MGRTEISSAEALVILFVQICTSVRLLAAALYFICEAVMSHLNAYGDINKLFEKINDLAVVFMIVFLKKSLHTLFLQAKICIAHHKRQIDRL